jgi:hypothetical protein
MTFNKGREDPKCHKGGGRKRVKEAQNETIKAVAHDLACDLMVILT